MDKHKSVFKLHLRSAMTNPTGKNKFEAGKKGKAVIASAIITIEQWACDRALHADHTRPRPTATVATVAKFLGSPRCVTRGTVSMVQSQLRLEGLSRSQALRPIR